MDFTQVFKPEQLPLLAFAIATIVGIVNMVQLQFPKVVGVYALLLGVGVGLVGGFFHIFGLTPELGLAAGFAGSGVYKIAQKAGGN